MKKLAGVAAEELTDFKTGDHVMTVDGFPGQVTAVNYGPYPGTETYQVELDRGMGGGDYNPGQLSQYRSSTASVVEAYDVTSSIPVEATTDHTANIDYPELEDILTTRLPNENIKIYAARAINQDDQANAPEAESDDPGENLEQDQPVEDPDDDADDTANDQADPEGDPEAQNGPQVGDVNPPDACSYCGNATFGDPQMTGRGVRMRCEQCGGTMVSWGGQWQPEFPNSPQNNASEQWDYRSGGPGGRGQAPIAPLPGEDNQPSEDDDDEDGDGKEIKIKVSSVLSSLSRHDAAESLQSQAGIVQYLFNKLYDKARARYENQQNEWWKPPIQDLGTNLEGPAQYNLVEPKKVTLGSQSELDEPEWRWHFCASWMDVQAKARRIRREGGVKIVAASNTFVSGEVNGEHSVYETQLNYVPGTRKVADWACGCKWAAYTWGRSPQYQRFEGRLCSHALATQYEANSRGIFNKEVKPDSQRPSWQHAHSPVVVQFDKAKDKNLTRRAVPPANMRRTFSSYTLDSDGIYPEPRLVDLQHAPLYVSVVSALDHGTELGDLIEMIASYDVPKDEARAMLFEALLSDEIPEGTSLPAGGPESGSDLITEGSTGKKKHHHTHQEHGLTYGYGFGWGWGPCGYCGGSGCGNCHGTGQVPASDPGSVGDGGAVDAGGDAGGATGGDGGAAGGGATSSLHTADYSTADPLAGLNGGHNLLPSVPHSNSHNPASTGWATSQDPQDWGRSMISNDFGVTFDAALHVSRDKTGLNPNEIQHTWDVARTHGYKWAGNGPDEDYHWEAYNRAKDHEAAHPGLGIHYQDGFLDGVAQRHYEMYGRQLTAAKTVDGPTVSGVALKAADTGRVLMIQRSNKNPKDPARGTWEMPGGHHEPGDLTSLHAGIREWEEEIGQPFPEGGHVTHVHRSGPYALHTVVVPDESCVDFTNGRATVNPDDPDGDDHEQAAWWEPSHAAKNPALRSELKKSNPFDQIKKAAATEPLGYTPAAEDHLEAMLDPEPEGALPSTDGDFDDEYDPGAGNSADNLRDTTFDNTSGDIPNVDEYNTLSTVGVSKTEADIIAEFQRTAGGRALAKEAMKDFSFAEQQDLINEGKGSRARNFSDMKIEGTHYALMPEDMDDDETVLWV